MQPAHLWRKSCVAYPPCSTHSDTQDKAVFPRSSFVGNWFPRMSLLGSSVNKGDGKLRLVLAQQRGPESSSSLGPRPSINGLVVCALSLCPLLDRRRPRC